MTAARKIIALLIIVFFGIPILFGVIWVVGLTKATVSAEFLSDLPREIVEEIPHMAEEIFMEAQSEKVIRDENTRAWFQAAGKAGVTPKLVMEETGILSWLRNELSESLGEVGEVLRGERRPRSIVLDLRPLKNILLRDDIDTYVIRILENLPPCDEEGIQAWMQIADQDWDHDELPACRPNLVIARKVLNDQRIEAITEMEEEIEIFEDVPFIPFGISRAVTWLSSFLFLVPAFFIFIGALIAAASPASFFRWSGISILAGAIPALLLSLFVKSVSLWVFSFVPFSFSNSETWSSDLSDLVLEKTSWIPTVIADRLFSPVVEVSGIVCIIGLVIFVISFMIRGKTQTRVIYRQTAAPPEAPEKPGQAEKRPDEKEIERKEGPDKETDKLKHESAESTETSKPETESKEPEKKEE